MRIFNRTIIKFSVFFSLFLFSGQTLFAQPPSSLERTGLYQKYADNYQSDDPEKLKIALEAAKEYVSKFATGGSDEMEYFKASIAALENKIKSKSAVSIQGNHCIEGMFFNDILSKFTTRRIISSEPINKELIVEIPKRKIGFELNEADEKTLKDAGANDSVIKFIHENVLREAIEFKFLYEKYLNNYQSNKIENLKVALETAKEIVEKFENRGCYAEYVKYYKEAIPELNKAISSMIR